MQELNLSPKTFEKFRTFVYEKVGISLSEQKATLIKGRLSKRIRALGLDSFEVYYEVLIGDASQEELHFFISAISTNVTSFFRETAQWKWLEGYIKELVEAKKGSKKLRIWSAGCSSGEEPYTILMFLQQHLSDFDSWDIKILATDISKKVLAKAIDGSYEAKSVESLPKDVVARTFNGVQNGASKIYQVKPALKSKVLFRMFNLITDEFIFTNSFDMIFCRNVMIYFDDKSRQELIGKFASLLPTNAPLFLGSSESLTSQKASLKLLGSSIYQKQ